MSKFLKKILLSFFIFLSLTTYYLILNTSSASAQEPGVWYDQSYDEWYAKVYGDNSNEIFGERYTAAQVQWVIYSLFYQIDKGLITKDLRLCSATGNCAEAILGALKSIPPINQPPSNSTGFIHDLTSPKMISASYYFQDLGRRWKLIPEAKAADAGFGFGTLNPVLDLWRGVRNAAYSLLVMVVVGMAFMIMGRVKISPQVVITVQSALPTLAVTILFISFSYPIAGLAVDLMQVFLGLIASVLNQAGMGSFMFIYNVMTTGFFGLGMIGNMVVYIGLFFVSLTLGLTALIPVTEAQVGLGPIFGIVSLIISIIVGFLLLISTIKIAFMLLRTLASIFMQVIFAPLQIGLGAVVSSAGFGPWLKGLIGNLAVFPVTAVLFFLALWFVRIAFTRSIAHVVDTAGFDEIINFLSQAFGGQIAVPTSDLGSWPLLTAPIVGGASERSDALIFLGVSYAVISIIPKTVELIQGVIQGKPFAYGTAVGESFGLAKAGGVLGVQYGSSSQQAQYEAILRSGVAPTAAQQQINAIYDAIGKLGIIKRK